MGDFVCGMKHPDTCKDAQENNKLLFWLKFHFFAFLLNLEDLKSILTTLDKLQPNEMKNLISIVE